MATEESLGARVAANPVWYHTMELAPGVVTPGFFDLRPVLDLLPWPDVRGKRCLDIGTYDGFLAFEMERRGAAEVVATDLSGHADWDWPPRERALGPAYLEAVAGTKGRGFEIAAEALGSAVQRRFLSVYDLSPEEVGTFDVVVCGSLLLHLRDPFRALEAVRSVCRGSFLSSEQIDLRLEVQARGTPALRLNGSECQWLLPNARGHRRMLEVAGFDIERSTRPFVVPFGAAHPPVSLTRATALSRVLLRRVNGGRGMATAAALARPAS